MEILEEHSITSDFYLSSIFLTIFTCSLQQTDSLEFNSCVFDLFFAEGWFSMIKIIVILSLEYIHLITDKTHDEVA